MRNETGRKSDKFWLIDRSVDCRRYRDACFTNDRWRLLQPMVGRIGWGIDDTTYRKRDLWYDLGKSESEIWTKVWWWLTLRSLIKMLYSWQECLSSYIHILNKDVVFKIVFICIAFSLIFNCCNTLFDPLSISTNPMSTIPFSFHSPYLITIGLISPPFSLRIFNGTNKRKNIFETFLSKVSPFVYISSSFHCLTSFWSTFFANFLSAFFSDASFSFLSFSLLIILLYLLLIHIWIHVSSLICFCVFQFVSNWTNFSSRKNEVHENFSMALFNWYEDMFL